MENYDIVLRGATVFGKEGSYDMAISGGKIAAVESAILGKGAVEIDAAGQTVIPSFIDSHMHLDKVQVKGDYEPDGLMGAIKLFKAYQAQISKENVEKDVQRRASSVIDMALKNGTGTIKTHVIVDPVWGIHCHRAILELKQQYKGRVDILNIVPWEASLESELDASARRGEIDFLAGYPTIQPDYKKATDEVFAHALTYDIPIDLHVDESDAPNVDCFEYVVKKTIECSLQGRVTCGHVTALNNVSDERAKAVIDLAAQAGINIITLPSCNMFLMGRHDKQPIRRGVTRIDEFIKAGVNVSFASDNVRDPFRPFGNADMLEEALFCAQVIQYSTTPQYDTIVKMGTYNPAKNALIANYGLNVGNTADIVVLDAPNTIEAIKARSTRAYVIKGGKVVVKDGKAL